MTYVLWSLFWIGYVVLFFHVRRLERNLREMQAQRGGYPPIPIALPRHPPPPQPPPLTGG